MCTVFVYRAVPSFYRTINRAVHPPSLYIGRHLVYVHLISRRMTAIKHARWSECMKDCTAGPATSMGGYCSVNKAVVREVSGMGSLYIRCVSGVCQWSTLVGYPTNPSFCAGCCSTDSCARRKRRGRECNHVREKSPPPSAQIPAVAVL